MEHALADVIHSRQCSEGKGDDCERYHRGRGDKHYDFYHDRAANIMDELAPVVGSANVLTCVRVVIDELC
jgi:hypothetical protein